MISFTVFLTRLLTITKAGQDLINAIGESKLQLDAILTTYKPSLYFEDDGTMSQDSKVLFTNKLALLHRQLDNKSPISPFSGTLGIWQRLLIFKAGWNDEIYLHLGSRPNLLWYCYCDYNWIFSNWFILILPMYYFLFVISLCVQRKLQKS